MIQVSEPLRVDPPAADAKVFVTEDVGGKTVWTTVESSASRVTYELDALDEDGCRP